MRIRVVTRPMLASGFELAGLAVTRANDGRAAAEALQQWAGDRDVGVVLVDEVLHKELPRDLVKRLDRQAVPIIALVPTPRWDERSEAEAYVAEMLRQAIGYRVRPR